MCPFQTKSQENFAIFAVFKWADCWYAADRIWTKTVRENMALWNFAWLSVGQR